MSRSSLIFRLVIVAAVLLLLTIGAGIPGAARALSMPGLLEVWPTLTAGGQPGPLLLILPLALLAHALGVVRWRMLLNAQDAPLAWARLVRHWVAGSVFAPLPPAGLGRTAYRLYASARETGSGPAATGAIAAELAAGFWAFTLYVLLAAGGVWFVLGWPVAKLSLGMVCLVLLALSLAAGLVLLQPRIVRVALSLLPVRGKETARRFGGALTVHSGRRLPLAGAFLLSLAMQAAWAAAALCLVSARQPGAGAVLERAAQGFFTMHGWLGAMLRDTTLQSAMAYLEEAGVAHRTVLGQFALLAEGLLWLAGGAVFLLTAVRPVAARSSGAGLLELLPADEARAYRGRIAVLLGAGIAAGLLGGAMTGLAEAGWVTSTLADTDEGRLLWWGPLVYGLCFMPLGLSIALALAAAYVTFGRFRAPMQSFGICLGASLMASIVVIGRWRFSRDVLYEQPLNSTQILIVLAVAVAAGLLAERVCSLLAGRVQLRLWTGFAIALAAYAGLVGCGGLAEHIFTTDAEFARHTPRENDTRPNIVFIVSDTQRADYMSLYGPDARAATPRLEKLAGDGVVFDRAFSQAGWTKPSFGTLWTGLEPAAHKAAVKGSRLDDAVPTIAEMLAETGYYTVGFPNNPHIQQSFGFHRGFVEYHYLEPEHYFAARPSVRHLALYEVLSRLWNKVLHRGSLPVHHTYRPAARVTDHAIEWIATARPEQGPFYLFLHYMDCHDPYLPAGAEETPYARSMLGPSPDPEVYLEVCMAAYAAEVERVDEGTGRLMDYLREAGLYDNTLVIFTSDHGEEFFEHNGWWHGATLYDEMTHMPLIVKFPRNAAAGTRVAAPAHHLDMAPTMLAAAEIPVPDALEGRAWTPRNIAEADEDRILYLENTFNGGILRGMRAPDGKLIHNIVNGRLPVPWEYYQLETDPGEERNLAEEEPPGMRRLRTLLEEHAPYFGKGWLD